MFLRYFCLINIDLDLNVFSDGSRFDIKDDRVVNLDVGVGVADGAGVVGDQIWDSLKSESFKKILVRVMNPERQDAFWHLKSSTFFRNNENVSFTATPYLTKSLEKC